MKYHISMLSLGVIAFVLLFSASCFPEFKNPLPIPKDWKTDRAILGTWETMPGREKFQVSFFQKEKSGPMYVVWINIEDGPPDVAILRGNTTSLNKDKFLCLWFIKKIHPDEGDDKEEPMCQILNYQISKEGILTITMFSQVAIEQLIEKGELKGEIEKGKYIYKVTVTSSSEELATAIIKEGIEYFISEDESSMEFQRLKQ